VLPAALFVLAARCAALFLPPRWLLSAAPGGADTAARLPEKSSRLAHRVGDAVALAGRRLGGNCVAQALAALCMLKLAGLSPALSIGVRKGPKGALRAHAWLRCGEVNVVGGHDDLATYERLRRAAP
jgi:hypothetical protein